MHANGTVVGIGLTPSSILVLLATIKKTKNVKWIQLFNSFFDSMILTAGPQIKQIFAPNQYLNYFVNRI